jgi:hypothetical protein
MKVYLNNELSNEQYHADTDHINGSGLWNIYDRCPAAWRYKDEEDEQSKALVFGTGSHTALLEPERFEAEYARMPTKEDFGNDLLVTVSDMNSWAKERGIKGLSGKSKDDVISIIQATGESVKIYDVIREEAEKAATGKQMLEGTDYDAIQQMRAVIHANSYYSSLLAGAYAEVSILGELNGEPSKVRFDCLTKGGDIIDYKTTVSAKPDEFFRHAARLGYFMKMAMQHDMFVAAYGHAPLLNCINVWYRTIRGNKCIFTDSFFLLPISEFFHHLTSFTINYRLNCFLNHSGVSISMTGLPIEYPGHELAFLHAL